LNDAESESDGGVSEGHDRSDNGQPPYLIEIGDLREDELRDAEDEHVRGAAHMAGVLVSFLMEAVRSLDSPVSNPDTPILASSSVLMEQRRENCFVFWILKLTAC